MQALKTECKACCIVLYKVLLQSKLNWHLRAIALYYHTTLSWDKLPAITLLQISKHGQHVMVVALVMKQGEGQKK